MYCPQCSQQQVSDEMRFCARCGLPLSGVRELVASGGVAAAGSVVGAQSALSKSQKGVRRGTLMMLVSFPLALLVGLLSAIDDVFAVLLLLPLLCFVAGFARLLYGVFWEERRARAKEVASQAQVAAANPAQVGAPARGTGLPPARFAPVEDFTPQRMKTAEILQPPSVTENTTRLLEDEADANHA